MKIGKSRTLSVDVGTTKIRVCDISTSHSVSTLSYYDEIEIPASREERDEFLKTEGRAFIKRQPSKLFYASLPGKGILSRVLSVPVVPLKKLNEILKYEVQQQIPFPLEMVEWEYQILSKTEQHFNILLAAVKKDLVSEFLSRLNMLGINSVRLYSDLFAIVNSFAFSTQQSFDKCQGILEIGANSANFIVIHKDKMLLRSLTTSGDTITSAIAEAENISFKEAEEKKIQEAFNVPVVASTVENLNTEIQNSIDYWRFTLKGPELEGIHVSGRGALMQDFSKVLEEKSRLHVSIFNPFSTVALDSKLSSLKERGPELSVLTGIALAKDRHGFININLMPADVEQVKSLQANKTYLYLSALIAGLIAFTPSLFLNYDKVLVEGIHSDVDSVLNSYERYKPEVDTLQGEIDSLEQRANQARGVIDQKSIWIERLVSIGDSLPSSRIYLTSFLPGYAETPAPSIEPRPDVTAPGVPAAPVGPGVPAAPAGPGAITGPGVPASPAGPGVPGTPARQESADIQMPPEPPLPGRGAGGAGAAGANPGITQPPVRQQAAQPAVQTANNQAPEADSADFTIWGKVVVTDISTAFDDLKRFTGNLEDLEFVEDVSIMEAELSVTGDELEFALLLRLKN